MKYLLLILLFSTGTVLADVYKWVDTAGHTHFGDKPHEDEKAEKITLKVTPAKPNLETSAHISTKQVSLYSTSWCGYCKKAREFFRKENIAYTDYDIEKDAEAKRKYDAFGGKGVPVIFIGEERINGFDATAFSEIYHR